MTVEFGDDFVFGERIELFQKNDGGGRVFSVLTFGLEFVADLSGADQNAVGFADFGVGDDVQEILVSEICKGRTGVGMAQHALGSEYDQRLAPVAQGLAAQQVKILRGVTRLRDLDIVFRGELDESFDSRAGVFRSLALVAVGQEHHDAGEQVPLGFAGADELVNDGLGNVDEVAELGFPQYERFGIVAAVAVFEAEDSGFGKCRVIDFTARLAGRDAFQRHEFVFVLDVDEDGVALVERAAASVLSAKAYGNAGLHQTSKRERFGHAVIDGAFARAHLGALLQQLLNFGMNVEARGIRSQASREFQ